MISGGVVASLLHRPAMNVKAYGLEAHASEWPGTQAKTHSCGSRLARALSEVRSEPSQSLRLGVMMQRKNPGTMGPGVLVILDAAWKV